MEKERNMKKPNFYSASDYAGLRFEGGSFYYGYEHTQNDEWCFVAKLDGVEKQIEVPFSKLGAKDQWNCVECLMIGIGWVLTKYNLARFPRENP